MEKKSNNSSSDDVEMLSFFSPAAATEASPRFLLLNLFLLFVVVLVTKLTEETSIIGCRFFPNFEDIFLLNVGHHCFFFLLLFFSLAFWSHVFTQRTLYTINKVIFFSRLSEEEEVKEEELKKKRKREKSIRGEDVEGGGCFVDKAPLCERDGAISERQLDAVPRGFVFGENITREWVSRNLGKRPIHGLGVETYGEVFLHQRVILHRRVRHWGRIRTRERVCYDWCAHGFAVSQTETENESRGEFADGFDASGGATVRGWVVAHVV
jgi:hypothetical protein